MISIAKWTVEGEEAEAEGIEAPTSVVVVEEETVVVEEETVVVEEETEVIEALVVAMVDEKVTAKVYYVQTQDRVEEEDDEGGEDEIAVAVMKFLIIRYQSRWV